jgi:NAD(P)-dependent dehydrogenase (short-subunit alcohol dehydrogenase family)
MSAPAPAALQNLRSLVLRDHALNLKQKIIFRRAANRMVQKNDIRARPVKLLDEKPSVPMMMRQRPAGSLKFATDPTKSLAQECAGKGIAVNVICPGYIATNMVKAVPRRR